MVGFQGKLVTICGAEVKSKEKKIKAVVFRTDT